MEELTPDMIVWAYSQGMFPMAESRHARSIQWYVPDPRAVLPLDAFHIPHGLRRALRKERYRITMDQAFEAVMRACAQPRKTQNETWINDAIIRAYTQLHQRGQAHSVEAWMDEPGQPSQLIGGLYGVSLGAVFFGESMFSRATDASKICLVHLVTHLRQRDYVLLDAQLPNPHLRQFGVIEIPAEDYLRRLQQAIRLPVTWA